MFGCIVLQSFFVFQKLRALYDYDPLTMSPNTNSDAELAFKTGDIITIYGEMVSTPPALVMCMLTRILL